MTGMQQGTRCLHCIDFREDCYRYCLTHNYLTTIGLLTGLFLVYIGTEKNAKSPSCFDRCLPGTTEEKETELIAGQNRVDIGEGQGMK